MDSLNVSLVASTSQGTGAAVLLPSKKQYVKQHRLADILCMADDLATTWLDGKLGFATHKTHSKPTKNLSHREIDIIERQKSIYVAALSENSEFKFERCHRYVNDGLVGAKVVATIKIIKGQQIQRLCGYMCKVDESYIQPGINDFSLVHSAYRNTTRLWLGPAAYVNHDCESNCVIYSVNGQLACLKATKTIEPGEELTVNYGSGYFNPDECQCITCETKGSGSFSSCQVDALFECHICGHQTKFKSWLARHIAGHMGEKYSCSLCDRTYASKSALKRHEYYHLGNVSFQCDLCHRRFTRKYSLAVHMRTHESCVQNVVKCPECPKTFKHNRDLGYHKNRMHTMAKPYICNICGEAFHAPTNVYKHKKRVH